MAIEGLYAVVPTTSDTRLWLHCKITAAMQPSDGRVRLIAGPLLTFSKNQ